MCKNVGDRINIYSQALSHTSKGSEKERNIVAIDLQNIFRNKGIIDWLSFVLLFVL